MFYTAVLPVIILVITQACGQHDLLTSDPDFNSLLRPRLSISTERDPEAIPQSKKSWQLKRFTYKTVNGTTTVTDGQGQNVPDGGPFRVTLG
ncbi:hypothetical protein COOONC_05026 [Cooperia oncophora]